MARFKLGRILGFATLGLLALEILVPGPIGAASYPTKPIDLIVCWQPPGVGDTLARLLAEEAKKFLPKPIIVSNRPGASGTIGAYQISKAAPDGYTLMLGRAGHLLTAPLAQKVEYNPLDFEALGQMTREPVTFAVRSDAPWKTLTELIQYAKKNPGAVTCGNAGTYSSLHLEAVRFEKLAGIELTHVPFKGSGDAMNAVAGGHTMMVSRNPGEGEPLIDAGKVRVLSVLDTKRCKFYPQVPASSEEGIPMSPVGFTAIMAPKGTPREVMKVWQDFLQQVVKEKSFVEKAESLKINLEYLNGDDFKKYLAKQIQEYGKMTRQMGLNPQ